MMEELVVRFKPIVQSVELMALVHSFLTNKKNLPSAWSY
jgi:hypothetical protein